MPELHVGHFGCSDLQNGGGKKGCRNRHPVIADNFGRRGTLAAAAGDGEMYLQCAAISFQSCLSAASEVLSAIRWHSAALARHLGNVSMGMSLDPKRELGQLFLNKAG